MKPIIDRLSAAAVAVIACSIAAPGVFADTGPQFNLESVQGILAVQQLDGWLLYDYQKQNPIAHELVNPKGEPTRRWFYLIPTEGEPLALIHRLDTAKFAHVPGRKAVYTTYRQFEKGLASMLKGRKRIAMEYSAKAALPSLSRVDAGTIELVRSRRVKIRSSAELVQFARSLWGPGGRVSHYVATHHLEELRKAALAFVTRSIKSGDVITELDVQKYILRGYRVRGLTGPPPRVAAGVHTADPQYSPDEKQNKAIARGDLVLIDMAAKVKNGKRAIYADTTWMAFVGDDVPLRYSRAFITAARARDAALELIEKRFMRRRLVKGFEVDREARAVIEKAGLGDRFVHRTGHSLDTDVHGAGANLDDYETRDTRNLITGAGFSIAPGIYMASDFGVSTEINVYLGQDGVEVTTPRQNKITALLASEK